jgi:ribosomal-protein-alanine N-acetyltransferase
MITKIKELILNHNNSNDGIYIPYDIDDFIKKIKKHAVIQTYYKENNLKGFIAYYANDPFKYAFLTMILIDKNCQGERLGKLLLESSIQDLKNRKFHSYGLEVLKQNQRAILFYEKFGFKKVEAKGDFWLMKLNLNEN